MQMFILLFGDKSCEVQLENELSRAKGTVHQHFELVLLLNNKKYINMVYSSVIYLLKQINVIHISDPNTVFKPIPQHSQLLVNFDN